jgi:toluene monooxygenase system ferredoxin subunit
MPLAELWSGEKLGIELEGQPILLVRLQLADRDGAEGVRAYDDRCLHKRALLSRGSLQGTRLTCAAHAWEYELSDGRCVNPPGLALRRFAVRVRDGAIWIDPAREELGS